MSDQTANLFVNDKGFVYADGAKICRITPAGELEFIHKGNRDSARRGEKVTVRPADLVKLAALAAPPPVRGGIAPPPPEIGNNPR
jgi:hypothetical protein